MLGGAKRVFIVVGVVLGLAMIYTTGSEQRASEAQDGGGGSEKKETVCAMTVTADLLNVRSGPGTGHEILGKFRQGAEIDATTQVRDGFRKIDDHHWAADEYLEPVDGDRCE
ncbi:SH3 domain-containing protein [Saccharomonospora sp.]|uniref:SH3 domain-containing protein n=1 Tax=Saccharomonospora sp. TaxID=33913 RepID=UPI002605E49F|nr:SH3 domain-containing protein [Saccharomonospora sp.]